MADKRTRLSAHFAAAEFDCNDGTQWPPAAREALEYWCRMLGEPLRAEFGPVRVTSGFRTPAYNRRVGGAPDSFHVYSRRYGAGASSSAHRGVAVDVVPARGTPQQWRSFVVRMPSWVALGSIGRGAAVPYPGSGFIHLDTGPRRSWSA